jgi:hypothetical protein
MTRVEPLFFDSPQAFGDWLEQHHDTETEVLVGFWKAATGKPSLTWSESVDEALSTAGSTASGAGSTTRASPSASRRAGNAARGAWSTCARSRS